MPANITTPTITLKEFLDRYPWQKTETGSTRPQNFLWKFSLPEAVADLWPFLIDTSTFNKLLALPRMTYVEKDGRLFGSSVNAGILSEWEEVPWEWEYHKGLNNARIYSKGFATYVRSRYLLVPNGNATDFYVYFGWVPRTWWARLLLKVAMPRLRKDYERALKKITEAIHTRRDFESRQRAIYAETAPEEKPVDAEHEARLEALVKRAVEAGGNSEDLHALAKHIVEAPEEELTRLKPKMLARQLSRPLEQVLKTSLYATHAGILALSWDVTCPHCRGVRKSVGSLGDLPQEERCDVCDINFSTSEIGNLEVIFQVNPEIRKVEKKFFCAAEPATKRHIYLQRRVLPQTTVELNTDFDNGEYRARVIGDNRYTQISVGAGSEKKLALKTGLPQLSTAPQPDFVFANETPAPLTLVIERKDEDNDALRPAEIFGLQTFRDLFGSQTLAEGLKIELGTQNILFTDIVGSTALYLKSGDGEAFTAVRRHFQRTYEVIRRNNGAVVKTIGDSAMVAFADALQCIRAAVELQREFNGDPATGAVLLRVSIHSGPCLAVNLNNGIDYFGNTVNFAAKLQQMAGAREIAYSAEFAQDKRVAEYLRAERLQPELKPFSATWTSAPLQIPVVRIA
ncbi:adenylate/guanylate cyclase domain-containing protein [Turneriella parva]|uniref:Adenylate/guanylate cyclase n=1 Tax=Turneriella parva (strain ATCC BAA-1111 / DSM 21527 / NCTC 11395 / H) TaxID=869212 RepID=I4B0F8_TURPD|nr:adenylate/guanylate cyclase domain-containing protein [Turneriella parva]AFM10765.1 adenylate/guanylate cyclase [Turneriella parva DSM 21527]